MKRTVVKYEPVNVGETVPFEQNLIGDHSCNIMLWVNNSIPGMCIAGASTSRQQHESIQYAPVPGITNGADPI